MSKNVLDVSDDNFEETVLKSQKPTLVDFWAPWCGPCKAVGPLIDELAVECGDSMQFVKMNVDDNPATPGNYGIRSIPTLIFFKNGNVEEQIVGMVAKSKIKEFIKEMTS